MIKEHKIKVPQTHYYVGNICNPQNVETIKSIWKFLIFIFMFEVFNIWFPKVTAVAQGWRPWLKGDGRGSRLTAVAQGWRPWLKGDGRVSRVTVVALGVDGRSSVG